METVVREVSAGESGKGLPYAPENWPNEGDIWSWRVGHRFSKQGIFQDRYLRVPTRLQKKETRLIEFSSKLAVERFLRSRFPDADIDAFFDSFMWIIRVKPQLVTGKRVRRRQTKHTPAKKLKRNREDEFFNFNTPKDEISNENDLNYPMDLKEETQDDLTTQLEEFDSYLKSLDENIDENNGSSSMEDESMTDSRKKLSSLLAMGTLNSLLLQSENTNELIALSYKLQNDPNLNKEELSILNLIQSIPFIRNSFLEAKEISSKADEFFSSLNSKIESVASLKEEYKASKEEMETVKAYEATTLLDMLDLDQKIEKLEKLREELAGRIKHNNELMNHWNSVQKKVMESLPKVINDVQMAKSEKSTWELKKKKAADLEAEILAKFTPLDGFSF